MPNTLDSEVLYYMLPIGGTVGAGTPVLQFPFAETAFKNIALPILPIPAKDAILYPVSGDSLAGERIFDGDIIIANKNFNKADVKAVKTCVVLLYGVDMVAKHVHFEGDGSITLSSVGADGKYYWKNVEAEQVEILGIMVGSYRPAPA